MVASMVAPKLSSFDLWVHPLSESDDDGDAEGFLVLLAQPLQATTNGAKLPNVISVSYGTCESDVSPYTASRTLVERQLTATAALGITTVVAAGDTGSSACARGVKPSQLTSSDKKPQVSWPASSPWVLAVGGTNLTLDAGNGVASTGPWNDTVYPAPFNKAAGGGGGQSTFEARPWWQPAQSFASSKYRMVPDVAAFADESPGYPIVCSYGVQGCPGGAQSIAFVGGTSASTPLVAGMVALWAQQARNQGLPKPGFVPPLLYATAKRNPEAFIDITIGQQRAVRRLVLSRRGPASTSRRAGDRQWRTPSPACSARAAEGGVLPRRSTRTPHCGAAPRARGSRSDPVPLSATRGLIMSLRQHSDAAPTSTNGADDALMEQLDKLAVEYGNRFLLEPAPDNALPKHGMRSVEAMRLIGEELVLDGIPMRNLATFVTTWMEPEAQRIIVENLHRNFIDHAEYPQTAEIEQRCIRMLADLFHAPGRDDGCAHAGVLGGDHARCAVAEVEVAQAARSGRQGRGPAEPRVRRRRARGVGEVLPLLRRGAADHPAPAPQVHDRPGGRGAARRREHDRRRGGAGDDVHGPCR